MTNVENAECIVVENVDEVDVEDGGRTIVQVREADWNRSDLAADTVNVHPTNVHVGVVTNTANTDTKVVECNDNKIVGNGLSTISNVKGFTKSTTFNEGQTHHGL